MPKIIAIDYGEKRCGIAITDDNCIIGSPLTTVETPLLFAFLEKLFQKESIHLIVVGEARYSDGTASATTKLQDEFAEKLAKHFPAIKIRRMDESNSSKEAAAALVQGGMRKSQRRKRENLDKVSAALILQAYLNTSNPQDRSS